MNNLIKQLNSIKYKGFNPKFIIDIGANRGSWTKEIANIFTESKFLMIEGNDRHEIYLKSMKSEFVDYEIALLSDQEKEKNFYRLKKGTDELETGASLLREKSKLYQEESNVDVQNVKTKLLDNILYERNISPDFIKLDIQGAEILALNGGLNSLDKATFCLIETSFQSWNENAPLIYEVIHFMKNKGYIIYDICTLAYVDDILINADILFVKEHNDKFKYKF